MHEFIDGLIPAIGLALVHFVWQGALIGALAAFALRAAKHARPQVRYAIACAALLACAVVPLANVLLHLQATTPASFAMDARLVIAPGVATVAGDAAPLGWQARLDALQPLIVALWAAGASVFCLRTLFGVAWVRRMRNAPQPPLQARWQADLDALAHRFALRGVALRLVDALDSPVAAGLFRPVVLLPLSVALRMPRELVEALLAHELAHIRRHDYLVNLAQRAIEALLFYHPVTWWLSHRIRVERELIADTLAAEAIGDARRLAVALATLSNLAPHRPAHPHLAHAAHGGHLMSRIQQLVRPQQRHGMPTGRIALPLIGVAAACIAFYAQAQIGGQARAESTTTKVEAQARTEAQVARAAAVQAADNAERVRHAAETASEIGGKAAVQAAQASHAAAAAHIAGAEAAAQAAIAKKSAQTAQVTRFSLDDDDRDAWAIVRAGKDGYSMSGSTDDMDDISAAKRALNRDFIWYRRDGKAYVIDDPATVARVQAAWKDSDVIGEKMSRLGDKMSVHGKKMEGLGKQMEKLSATHVPSPAMMEAQRRMGALGAQQAELAGRQQLLAMKQRDADEAEEARLEREMDTLDAEMEKLSNEMDAQGDILDRESAMLDRNTKPMDDLGRQMEEASKPMEALGKEMEGLGKQQESLVRKAEKQMKVEIGEAEKKGLAKPAPRNSSQ